mmetsp:Transcript_49492/g.149164  ORF Transcript_49492/g.149164 Transcript_49492/m.149164 type:complete len:84 (+) Transcript_49492:2259-2510(+)
MPPNAENRAGVSARDEGGGSRSDPAPVTELALPPLLVEPTPLEIPFDDKSSGDEVPPTPWRRCRFGCIASRRIGILCLVWRKI